MFTDNNPLILELLAAGYAHCAGIVSTQGGLFGGLFLAGIVGSAAHCAGMCGPFVLQQAAARAQSVPAARMSEFTRISGAMLLPYHLGRLTTYAAIGAGVAALTGSLAQLSWFGWLPSLLLGLAALLFLAVALERLGTLVQLPVPAIRIPWSGWVSRTAAPLLHGGGALRGYLLGLVLGFIPCGLLYGAFAAAAGSADPVAGALALAAFGLGTMPALIGVALAGGLAWRRWQAHLTPVLPLLMLANAGMLGYLAWSMA
ncbi:MAG: sulfite exporter TauE/SafE family protein [Oceanibaculum nanhaiense]|uniref:sulfite exporter TauE/SafE family protein n=1 Tax=Oceanibaculum nanhaiense TaxID=1909734 RepID=UPI0025A45271|nr:sulfite exporter TauE/SafE family protein [Oceanibaculum nanhaiense]MDM7946471.1 sulfite exporter TauE/SafE family protein [Oceanibaculum nanhaiense]